MMLRFAALELVGINLELSSKSDSVLSCYITGILLEGALVLYMSFSLSISFIITSLGMLDDKL